MSDPKELSDEKLIVQCRCYWHGLALKHIDPAPFKELADRLEQRNRELTKARNIIDALRKDIDRLNQPTSCYCKECEARQQTIDELRKENEELNARLIFERMKAVTDRENVKLADEIYKP